MKKFLIVGSKNVIHYKDVFPYMKDKKVFIHIVNMVYGDVGVPSAWYNNIGFKKKEPLILTKTYNEKDYPKYDVYNAIEVSKSVDIPIDYDGVMGVPTTFLDKWDDGGFEVIGLASDYRVDEPWCIMGSPTYVDEKHKDSVKMVLNGKAMYSRILIKKKLQFEVIGIACGNSYANYPEILKSLNFIPIKYGGGLGSPILNNKPLYSRILIKRIP